eukprot:1398086-Prymnesium_polylepis.1
MQSTSSSNDTNPAGRQRRQTRRSPAGSQVSAPTLPLCSTASTGARHPMRNTARGSSACAAGSRGLRPA